jgi:transcriptional antiterminator RfaH
MEEEEEAASRSERRWYVLHVKPRTEKKAAWYLRRFKCFEYLPVRLVVRKVQRRKVKRELPLFPGYVFTRMDFDQRADMLRTNLVVRTIPIPRPRETIHQLRQIRRVVMAASDLKVISSTFHEGDRVRVKAGPMRGTEGYVKRDGGRAVLYLNVEILGTCVEVSVAPSEVERI